MADGTDGALRRWREESVDGKGWMSLWTMMPLLWSIVEVYFGKDGRDGQLVHIVWYEDVSVGIGTLGIKDACVRY